MTTSHDMLPGMSDVLEFLPTDLRLTHTRYGLMLYPTNDVYVGRCLEAYGEYCPEEGNAFRQLLKPGDVVVEAGANIGAHTLHLSQLVGSTGRIHAFEPQHRIFQILCANLALNNIGNVHARQQALGRAVGELWISPPEIGATANFGGIAVDAAGSEAVDVLTLDSLNIQRLDMIKADVEGMEEAVLRGATETIRRLRPKLYLENDQPGEGLAKSVSLIRLVRELGYRLWWHLPALYSPANFRNFQENIFSGNIVSVNMLCIRADEPVTTNFVEVGGDTDRPNFA